MSTGWWLLLAVAAVILSTARPLGRYLGRILGAGPAPGDRLFLPLERIVYRAVGVDPSGEQRWTAYAASFLAFSLVSTVGLYALLRLQGVLPFNPTEAGSVDPLLALNISVSFVTNTNWQNYAGEATLSHLSQAVGLVTQNFVSAAAGLAVVAPLIRGLAKSHGETLGNFWVDVTRVTVRLLLPLSIAVALVLISQGVIQNGQGFTEVETLSDGTQMVPGGPVASQIAIKQLGSNGGGFFNANSSHPFENPNALTNILEIVAIVLIPFAAPFAYGEMVGQRRQGSAVFAAMFVLWLAGSGLALIGELPGNPAMTSIGVDQVISSESPGGSLEGKEVRFGPGSSAVWAAATTGTSNGSVNAMHGSMTPVGVIVTLTNMLLGEVSPGGVGVGLAGMLVFVVVTVFIAGLMVGRTPELLGKKIQAAEVKLATLYLLAVPVAILALTAIAVLLPHSLDARTNDGPWGFTEILYGITSPAANNGSAMGGLSANTPFYNSVQALAMAIGRFLLIIPILALAGSLVRKQVAPESAGTFPTDTPLFVGLLIGVILIVAGLTFFPALALGPITEALR
jgi:K+-transporting ATPase ATPase A chain